MTSVTQTDFTSEPSPIQKESPKATSALTKAGRFLAREVKDYTMLNFVPNVVGGALNPLTPLVGAKVGKGISAGLTIFAAALYTTIDFPVQLTLKLLGEYSGPLAVPKKLAINIAIITLLDKYSHEEESWEDSFAIGVCIPATVLIGQYSVKLASLINEKAANMASKKSSEKAVNQ